jgi:four helix bundle protein
MWQFVNGRQGNIIVNLTFQFALDIIKYSERLQEEKKFVISNQLLKSGTSIGANIREAQNAESKADFIHKFKIAAKEVEETAYWLDLCKFSSGYGEVDSLIVQLQNIARIVNKIIITSKHK